MTTTGTTITAQPVAFASNQPPSRIMSDVDEIGLVFLDMYKKYTSLTSGSVGRV